MPFKEINIKSIIEQERKDKTFNNEYKKIKQEYDLIEKIVRARKTKKMTQEQLAKTIGVSQQAISRLEKEKHIPKMDTFMKILDGLDLEIKLIQKQ